MYHVCTPSAHTLTSGYGSADEYRLFDSLTRPDRIGIMSVRWMRARVHLSIAYFHVCSRSLPLLLSPVANMARTKRAIIWICKFSANIYLFIFFFLSLSLVSWHFIRTAFHDILLSSLRVARNHPASTSAANSTTSNTSATESAATSWKSVGRCQ